MEGSQLIDDRKLETVLVMQGGGSLGAYGCGVYKALAKRGIKFDIIAGTSIGAVNASIIVGNKNDDPAQALEDFWYTLAADLGPTFLPEDMRSYMSAVYSAFWGNPFAFRPAWLTPFSQHVRDYNPPYLYDITPLKDTLDQFIDFEKLNTRDRPRLIITSTDILKGEPVTFDSKNMAIDGDHIIACAGFPFYGIAWTYKDGRYLWDGALQSNTPLREVIDASPKYNKKVYMINLFPRNHDELPRNMLESWHRARDISHTDKTQHNIRMSKVMSKHIFLLKEMHKIIASVEDRLSEKNKARLMKIEPLYHKLASERGAIIKSIVRIERSEQTHFLFEDADFSVGTIKKLITQGEQDAEMALRKQRQ